MAQKNILSDSDYTKGWDNRFGASIHLGYVSKIECSEEHADVRVIMLDKVDHEGTPLNTKPIPVLQEASVAKKRFAMPRIGTPVAIVKLANGTSSYFVLGSFYTKRDPPPVTDPLLDYTEWEGGHTQKFDANENAEVFLTQDFKGGWKATVKKDIDIKTTDDGKISIVGEKDVLLKSNNGNINIESPTGIVTIKQDEIELNASQIRLIGNIVVTGNIEQSGVHHDNLGYHTGGGSIHHDALQRIAALEQQVHALQKTLASHAEVLEAHHQ